LYQEKKGEVNCISVEFSGYLLKCRFKSTSAYYKASTNTQIKHKNSTNTQETKPPKQYGRKKKGNTKEVPGQKYQTLKKHR